MSSNFFFLNYLCQLFLTLHIISFKFGITLFFYRTPQSHSKHKIIKTNTKPQFTFNREQTIEHFLSYCSSCSSSLMTQSKKQQHHHTQDIVPFHVVYFPSSNKLLNLKIDVSLTNHI